VNLLRLFRVVSLPVSLAAICTLALNTTLSAKNASFTTVEKTGVECIYTLSATSITLPSKGGSKTLKVKTTGTDCAWTAVSNDPFITITSGSSGTGKGTVHYTVPGNTNSTSSLSGTMTIAGQTFTVNQAIGGCTYSLSPKKIALKAAGGSKTIKVKPNFSNCDWTAVSNDGFITITAGASGTGSGTVGYSVAANDGAARIGTITVSGSTFTVTQAKSTAPTLPLTEVGSYLFSGGGLDAVYVVGTKVIIGFVNVDESGFEILDISNPATPTLLVHKPLFYGSYNVEPHSFYVVDNTLLYIATNYGLYVCDIQDPANPTEPQLIYYDNFWAVAVVDGLAYTTGDIPGGSGLAVIDLTSNSRIGYYDPPCCSYYGVCVKGNYAYVADGPDGGLQIIDITDPSNPIFAGQYLGGFTSDVSVKDTYAYVAGDGFQIINVANPAAPTLVTEKTVWGDAGSIFISGNRAFVSSQELNMFDITNPTSTKWLGKYQSLVGGSSVSGNTTHVVVVDYNTMRVFRYF
jgi:hypothetical protein